MADGVAITAGSGTTILTDDTGAGGHAQVVKLAIATDGSGTLIPADASGLQVQGAAADGAAVAGKPVLIAGQDGTNAQSISVDTTGRVVNVGAAATGAAVAGNPLLIGGKDASGNAQPIYTDSNGVQSVGGAAGVGTAVAGAPVLMGGSDGTNARYVLTDTAGNLIVCGNVAHDIADAGNPVKVGGVAVSGSATPTSVASGDRTRFIANQHGIPYSINGHPNLITREYDFGTAAQTDVNLAAAAVAADERVYVTRFEALCDNANTVNVSVRAGFGAANVPAASATGVSGMIASHPGVAPGSGFVAGNGSGLIAVGGAGEEPRLTSSAATTGNLHVVISYFLIDETP
jgi:hypothetical protein